MPEQKMTISEMCEAFEVTPRTLRFYEAKELIFPQRVGKKRLYLAQDRARLKLIQRGKRFGFSLESIRRLLNLYDLGNHQQLTAAYGAARKRLEEMIAQQKTLNEAIEELQEQIAWAKDAIATMEKSEHPNP